MSLSPIDVREIQPSLREKIIAGLRGKMKPTGIIIRITYAIFFFSFYFFRVFKIVFIIIYYHYALAWFVGCDVSEPLKWRWKRLWSLRVGIGLRVDISRTDARRMLRTDP